MKPRIAIVLAVVSMSAATIACSHQAEISDDLGRAHAEVFRDRRSGVPSDLEQRLTMLSRRRCSAGVVVF